MKERKLGFIELNQGKLGREVQSAFEQAQISAQHLNGKCTVNLSIDIFPPDDDGMFGHASYAVKLTEPPKKSAKLTTLLQDGLIVNDGANELETLQYALNLDLPEIAQPMMRKMEVR